MLPRRFQNPSVKDSDFGGCPVCGRTNGFHSVGPEHWYVCHTHRTKWNVGRNLFSSWKYLTEEEHRENHELLAGYRDVRDKTSSGGQDAGASHGLLWVILDRMAGLAR
jgi:hypothetical protein